jgi:prophage regulatory protein
MNEMEKAPSPERLLSRAEVMARTGLSRQTIYNWLAVPGRFPQPRKLGTSRLGWLESEIRDWINSRPLAVYPAKKWRDKPTLKREWAVRYEH